MDGDDLEIGRSAPFPRKEREEDNSEEDDEERNERYRRRERVAELSTYALPEPSCDVAQDGEDDDDGNEEDSEENAKESPPPLSARPALRREVRFKKRSSVFRRKSSVDVETGKAEEHVIQCQLVDDEIYFSPMNPSERWWKLVFRRKRRAEETASRQRGLQGRHRIHQYRLTGRKKARGFWNFLKWAIRDDFHANRGLNSLIADYLIWTFQTNIIMVFLASSSVYILFIMIFSIAFYIAGLEQPDCVNVGEYDFETSGHHFMDAVSLSWQTISTAGYGVVSPAIDTPRGKYCVCLNILTALESFWGVILVGCLTAIIFSKVVRVQAVAAVEFCDPLVVRYGTGVMPADDDDDMMSQVSSTDAEMISQTAESRRPRQKTNSNIENMFSVRSMLRDRQCPCPILEFRVINRLHDHAGGEICNAGVNVVAVTSASHASLSMREAAGMTQRHLSEMNRLRQQPTYTKSITKTLQSSGTILKKSAHRASVATGAVLQKSGGAFFKQSAKVIQKSAAVLQKLNQTLNSVPVHGSLESVPEDGSIEESSESLPKDGNEFGRPQSANYGMPLPVSAIEQSRRHLAVDEEPSSSLMPRRIFSKLDIETDRHPFFKRVWNIRHVLNENSPLLSNEAKRLIQENQGFWPEELNSYEKVRKHIHFHEIIVNFSGTSHVSGATVYSQKLYLFADLNVGYRFAQVLFKSVDGRLIVDSRLLNDVTEQYGGGAEPLTNVIDSRLSTEIAMDAAKAAVRATADVALSSADAVRVTAGVAQSTAAVAANTVVRATTGVAQATADVAGTVAGTLRAP